MGGDREKSEFKVGEWVHYTERFKPEGLSLPRHTVLIMNIGLDHHALIKFKDGHLKCVKVEFLNELKESQSERLMAP